DLDEEEFKAIIDTLRKALVEINTFRSEEGLMMEKDFLERIANLEDLLAQVSKMDVGRISTVRERLEKAVDDLGTSVDANRFEQELIYYLEKYDISEKKERLANHLQYVTSTLN